MPFTIPGKKWILIGAVAIIIVLSLGGWAYWQFIIGNSLQKSPIAMFSIDELLKVQPQWDRYDRLSQEIDEIQKNLRLSGLDTLESKGEGSHTPSPGGLFFPNQDGSQIQPGAMNLALSRIQENLMVVFQEKLKSKADYLQSEINEALVKEQADYDQKLKDYRRGIELEYSLKLADLETRLNVPGLSFEEKESINSELVLLKSGMNDLLTSKEQSFAGEIKGWMSQRRQEAEKTMGIYQSQLKKEFDRQMKQKAEQLQVEALKLNSLLAERQTLRFEMMSGIRRKLKETAKANNVSFIMANPSDGYQSTDFILAFPYGKDITNELLNLFR